MVEIIIRVFQTRNNTIPSSSVRKIVTDRFDRTLLSSVCTKTASFNQCRLVDILIKDLPESVNQRDTFGNSALYYAWANRNVSVVRTLLRNDATVIATLNCYSRLIDKALEASGKTSSEIQPIQPQIFYQTILQGLVRCHEKNLLIDYDNDIRTYLPVTLENEKVLDGMLLFKLLLELKSMKTKEISQVALRNSTDNNEQVKESYENDLARREEMIIRHKRNKLFHHNSEKQRKIALEFSNAQSQVKERIDRQFNESLTSISRKK
jgi:hypothetical protein